MNINYFDFNSRINLKKGYLLVAQPLLIDSYFNRSVILICDHNKNGTIGLQVNKPLKSNLKSITFKTLIVQKAFLGGPVRKNIDYIENLILNKKIQENQFKLFIGYSGWNSGQLEEELNENSWIVIPKFDINIIFSKDYKNIWKKVLNNSNKIHKMFSNYPINPRLN